MSVVGVIAYRVSMLAALQLIPDVVGGSNTSQIATFTVDLVYQNASLVTTVTAALINLLIIIILNIVSRHSPGPASPPGLELEGWEG